MSVQFHLHFTEFPHLALVLLLLCVTRLCFLKPKPWNTPNGIFEIVEKVFRVSLNLQHSISTKRRRRSRPASRVNKCGVFPLILLLISACSPSDQPNPTDLSSPMHDSHELSFASNSYWTGFQPPEPTRAKAAATPIREDQPEEITPVPGSIHQSAIAAISYPDGWKEMPIIPEINPNVRDIYAMGLSRGNNPHAFSKVGDCSTSNAWFLGPFDEGEAYYRLGEYTYLKPMIEHFQGSFARNNISTRNGFNAASALSPIWADPEVCDPGETPLACEYRVHKPSIVFIMLGTNDRWHMETFEENMREIIEVTLDHWIVPIIATKPDNFEGDESINRILAQLAIEYEVPLWNFWAAIQSLPNAGLEEDGVHLSWGPTRFDDPDVMKRGWPMRNLTAMQSLYAVWQAVYDSSVDEFDVLR
jgi:hypothetical protein